MTMIRQQPQANVSARAIGSDERWRVAALCLFLAAITFAVFGQTTDFGFVNFDDDLYVYQNAKVPGGLKSLAWIFTHADCSLYHPLTIVSLMADYQFHKLHAGWYHFTNVLLHTASVILLFLILRQVTGAFWRSAFVAAMFAIHPLRAESVAWVAERKDVLSAFFFMLTIGAYVHYVRNPKSLARYLLVAIAFVMALLSKPTVVTLPFVLPLLDYWPLQRLESRKLSGLVMEKLPLLALAAGACVLTVLAAKTAIASTESFPISSRVANALVSYVVYLRQMFWPEGLALFYPRPENGYSVWAVTLSFLLLASITGCVLAFRRKRPWLLVGWLWYLVMLTPMIGIVQGSSFAHADRVTYLPQIGLYLMLAWAAVDLSANWHYRRMTLGGLATIVLVALFFSARTQVAYWRDSETLWSHTLACTTRNLLAHLNLGSALLEKQRPDEAITHFQQALQIKPDYALSYFYLGLALSKQKKTDEAIAQYQKSLNLEPNATPAHRNLGDIFLEQGKVDDAISQFQHALQADPDDADAHSSLGSALLRQGRIDEAAVAFQKTLQIKPDHAQAHYNLGNIFLEKGKTDDAIGQYQLALQTYPDYAQADNNLGDALLREGRADEAIPHYQHALQNDPNCAPALVNLGGILLQRGNVDDAITHFQKALQINPRLAEAHQSLGHAFRQQGKMSEAIAQFEKALQLEPDDPETQNDLAWLLATCPVASLRNGAKAVQLAQRASDIVGGENPFVLRTVAAAFAEAGRFSDAGRSAQKAIKLAQAAGRKDLAVQLNAELKLYQAELPFHQ